MNRYHSILCTAILVTLASNTSAQSKKWAYVLDSNLKTYSIHPIQANSTTGISGIDQDGLPVQFQPDQYIGLWLDDHSPLVPSEITQQAYHSAMLVELSDGQRVSIVLHDSGEQDIIAGTRIDGNTTVRIPMDRVQTITRSRKARNQSPSVGLFDTNLEDDAIRLLNDDLFTGFITHIGTTVEIETTTNDHTSSAVYPIDQIHSIRVQNPSSQSPGFYILTSLRERLRVNDFVYTEDSILSVTFDDPMHTDSSSQTLLTQLVGVDQINEHAHLVDLASATQAMITPTGNRHWAPDPKFSTKRWLGGMRTNARVTSPVSMIWKLPEGSTRMTMWLNPWEREWTNNKVSIRTTDHAGSSRTLWSKSFDSSEAPMETILLDLPPGSLTLELMIDPAENGPIQDQFFIGFPLILVDGSPHFE